MKLTVALLLLGYSQAHAGVIMATSQTWSQPDFFNPSNTWQVQITSTVYDNFLGDTSRNEWRYTVTNANFSVNYPFTNGLSSFDARILFELPTPVVPTFRDFYGPSGWNVMSKYGVVGDFTTIGPATWYQIGSSDIPIGSSADFGFSIPKLFVVGASDYSFIGTYQANGGYIGPVGWVTLNGLAIPIATPEPGSMLLLACGLLVVMLQKCRHHNRLL